MNTAAAALPVTPPEAHLASARLYALRKAPYFIAALLGLIPRSTPKLGTVGVTAQMVLLYDPMAILRWTVPELGTVLLHEVGHVIRRHSKRQKRGNFDPQRWNEAADCEINDDLVAMGLAFPADGLLPRTYRLPDGLTAEEYYARMPVPPPQGGKKGKPEDDTGSPGNDPAPKGPHARCSGPCGSGAGNALPGEPTDGEGDADGDEGRGEMEVERIRAQVAEAIVQHAAKHAGSVPAGLRRWAETLQAPPKIRWQDQLARAVRHAVAYRPGAVDLRYSRPSRRQGALGYGPGAPILPSYVRPVPRVAVAIDTSGSMGGEELALVLREVKGVLAAVGAAVEYCACDAVVHALGRAQDVQTIARSLKGGGGTDFRPIFTALAQRKPTAEVVIVCTDGYGPAPSTPPAMRVVWCLVGQSTQVPAPWGTVVKVAT